MKLDFGAPVPTLNAPLKTIPLLQDIYVLSERVKEMKEALKAEEDRLGGLMIQLEKTMPEDREDDFYETIEVKGKAVRVIDIKRFKKMYPDDYDHVIEILRKEVEVKIPIGRCEAFIGKKKFADVTFIPEVPTKLKVVERGQ
jgi:hypothetical protein